MVCWSRGFPHLKNLKLVVLITLEGLRVEEEAMPNLLDLTICGCRNLKMIPQGMITMASIKNLRDLETNRSKSDIEKAVIVLWSIWNNRNDVIWNGKQNSSINIFHSVVETFSLWFQANQKKIFNNPPRTQQSNSKWNKPPRQFLKCNVDAAIFNSPPRMGFRCIIRDSMGEAIAAVHGCFPGVFDPRTAEALSIRKALSWLKDLSYSDIMVESYALTLIEALKKRSPDDSYVGLIIEDCRFLALELKSCSFAFVRRSANQVAHSLARAAGSLSGRKGRVVPFAFLVFVVVVSDL
ncbi:uncharacterized protein [Henckelia pumila]|uniref:uncharacterized protein n=1 Tax=Henckelia pumila TaxID=405737 RepID=UPI003C6E1D47